MMTVLTVKRVEPHGIGQKLLEILRPAKVTETIETAAGREYRRIAIEIGDRELPWKKIARLVGEDPLILPREITIPPQVPLERYTPTKLQPKLALRMLLSCLKPIPPSGRTVGLIDPDGSFQAVAMALAEEAATVRILTREPESYKVFQRQMLDLYGAPILVGERLPFLEDCMAVYCPAPFESGEAATLKGLFFAAAPVSLPGRCQILEDFSPACPKERAPEGIHPADFFGGLYELAGARELEDLPAAQGDCKGRPNRTGELSDYLRRTFIAK